MAESGYVPLSETRCVIHPSRTAVGFCMGCFQPYCAECVTRLDGINTCTRCIEGMRREEGPVACPPWQRAAAVILTAFLSLFMALSGLGIGFLVQAIGGVEVKSKAMDNVSRLEKVAGGIRLFRYHMGRYPDGEEGLDALSDREALIRGEKRWKGPYVRGMDEDDRGLLDAYGTPLAYRNSRDRGVFVASAGADGRWETDLASVQVPSAGEGDDIVKWIEAEIP